MKQPRGQPRGGGQATRSSEACILHADCERYCNSAGRKEGGKKILRKEVPRGRSRHQMGQRSTSGWHGSGPEGIGWHVGFSLHFPSTSTKRGPTNSSSPTPSSIYTRRLFPGSIYEYTWAIASCHMLEWHFRRKCARGRASRQATQEGRRAASDIPLSGGATHSPARVYIDRSRRTLTVDRVGRTCDDLQHLMTIHHCMIILFLAPLGRENILAWRS